MHRSFAWGMIAILAIMLAPFAGVLGVPGSVARADTAAPNLVTSDDEIIVITSTGQIRVDDPYTTPGYKPVSWNSGSDTGFTAVAAGDFNGDGDAELVAARGSIIKVFDPVVQPGRAPVSFTTDLGSGNTVRLLVTGDFDGDLKDEFAVIHYISGGARLVWYDGGANAVQGDWTLKNSATYGAMFQDMSTGDFNADGADDLVMVRNVSSQHLVTAWNVRAWSNIVEGSYSRSWYAVAGGKLSTSLAGDQISLTRDGANAATEGLILFKVVLGSPNKFADLATSTKWRWNPDFTSLANGDLQGDGDDEVVMLRDPTWATTSLLSVDPTTPSGNPIFEQATGYGSSAFKIVRTGDTDGDGKDEIVILKSDRYRIYTEPNVDSRAVEKTGAFYATTTVTNLPFMAVANVDGPGVPEGPTLNVTPTSLSFSLDCGDSSPLKPLSITNVGTGSSFAWQAQAIEDSGSGWLLLDTTSGTTPGTVNVSVRPGIAKGTYTGKVRISATDSSVQNTPVDVSVSYASLCSGFSASPSTLNFNLTWGSTSSQSVTIGGPASTAWTASVTPVAPTASCSWLTVSAMSGTTPSTVNVLVNAAIPDLSFRQCLIIFAAADPNVPGTPKTVTVNLTVPDPGFVVTPTDITILQKASVAPVIHYVTIFRPGGVVSWTASALPLTAAADLPEKLANGQATITAEGVTIDGAPVTAPDWLVLEPVSGDTLPTTPSMMQVSVKAGTQVGTYQAVITVAASGDPTVTNPVQMVYVTAHVADNIYATFLPLVIK